MGEIVAAAILFSSLYCGQPQTHMLFDPTVSNAPMFFTQSDAEDEEQPWNFLASQALQRQGTLAFSIEVVPEDRRDMVCAVFGSKGTDA